MLNRSLVVTLRSEELEANVALRWIHSGRDESVNPHFWFQATSKNLSALETNFFLFTLLHPNTPTLFLSLISSSLCSALISLFHALVELFGVYVFIRCVCFLRSLFWHHSWRHNDLLSLCPDYGPVIYYFCLTSLLPIMTRCGCDFVLMLSSSFTVQLETTQTLVPWSS